MLKHQPNTTKHAVKNVKNVLVLVTPPLQCIAVETKWPTFYWRHLRIHFLEYKLCHFNQHYSNVIMGRWRLKSPTSRLIAQSKLTMILSLAFVKGIHRWPVDSPHKGPVTRKKFQFDDVMMKSQQKILKFVAKGPIDNTSASVRILDRRLFAAKPLWNMSSTDICVLGHDGLNPNRIPISVHITTVSTVFSMAAAFLARMEFLALSPKVSL